MPGYRISLEIDGRAEFDRVFHRFGLVVSDFTPVGEEIKPEFWDIEKEQFQSEGTAGRSGRWKPRSPKYEAGLDTFALISGVLIRTGRLYKSMTRKTTDSIVEIDKQGMAIGTSLPYAIYHQRGSGSLPQREIISLSEKHKKRIMKAGQKGLLKQMKRQRIPIVE